jgi:CBS domain containing-hemolysin-like protein
VSGADAWLLVGCGLLVVVAGVLAGAESALSRVSRVRVEDLVREQRRGAVRLEQVVADIAGYVNVLLFLRLVCELTAVVLVTVVCLDTFAETWQAVLVASGAMVVVSYVVVGVAPRTLGRQHADRAALAAAPLVHWLARVLGPLTSLLIIVGNALTPGRGYREGPFSTEAELRDLVDLASERRLIEAGERQMIHSVFELGDTIVREVMVPRTDMVFVERSKTLRQAISLFLRSGFSRIPVIGENLDDVVGIAYLKDTARRTFEYREGESTERIESVMRPATFVPDSKPVDDLLREMQAQQIHVAIVVDEYGGTAGLVTIEDILEEIVGEITDEYDVEKPPVEELAGGAWRVTARLPVQELAGLCDVEIADEDVETVGGLLAKRLGRVPIPGAQVGVEGLTLTAESAEGRRNRIGTVLVTRSGPNGKRGSGRRRGTPVEPANDPEAVDA